MYAKLCDMIQSIKYANMQIDKLEYFFWYNACTIGEYFWSLISVDTQYNILFDVKYSNRVVID